MRSSDAYYLILILPSYKVDILVTLVSRDVSYDMNGPNSEFVLLASNKMKPQKMQNKLIKNLIKYLVS